MLDFIKSKKLYIIFFFAVTAIAALFPPSADDLGWATSQGVLFVSTSQKIPSTSIPDSISLPQEMLLKALFHTKSKLFSVVQTHYNN